MYSSGYSQVSRFSPEAQKRMQHRSKNKSCGYYMRIVFFFSSLIQSLIIVSLVLFLVYGKSQDSAASERVQNLEESYSRLSIENVDLKQQRKNLTTLLNVTVTEKAKNDWDLSYLRYYANISYHHINNLTKKLSQCNQEQLMCKPTTYSGEGLPPCRPCLFPRAGGCNCGAQADHLRATAELIQANFTQIVRSMKMELEQVSKDRDNINLEAIRLRRDKSVLEKELAIYKVKCKEEFAHSLSGISNVSRAFLLKIDSLIPQHIKFQLTCDKQREYLEQIRTNCTKLSTEVENKFQHYLNNVGSQVTEIQSENSLLKAENWRLSVDYRWCSQNRTGLIQGHRNGLQMLQLKHDQEKEQSLMAKISLNGDIDVLRNTVNFKETEIAHLKEQLKQLNISCMSKGVSGLFPSTSNLGTGILAQPGSSWNKMNTAGSSSGSSSSSGGGLFGRFGSPVSTSSQSNSGQNKLGSSGIGSSSGSAGSIVNPSSAGSGLTKLGLTVASSSNSGSSSGSTRSSPNLSSTVLGSSKTTLSGKSSSGAGSSSGSSSSTGSTTKSGTSSSGFSWLGLGLGSSNSGQSKSGGGTGRGSTGGSSGTSGGGRTTGLVGGPVSVSEHLQNLRRIVNPPLSEEKQDLPRILG